MTGAASGIGRATVERLLAEGATVVAVDVRPSGIESDRVAEVVGDISEPATSARAVQEAVDRTGALHVLANVAGILRTARTHEHELETWDQVLGVNLTGTFLACKAAIPALLDGGGGAIVNTASTAAHAGQAWAAAYSASKGAIVGMTLPIARDLSRNGIRVCTIAPGIFETPLLAGLPKEAQESLGKQVPFPSRLGRPAEYAQLVKAIVEIEMLNAETIRLDGAIRMAPK